MDQETLIRLLLAALGVKDVERVLGALEDEETEEPQSDGPDEADQSDEQQGDEEQEEEERTAEALMVAAVRELRGAVARLVESDGLDTAAAAYSTNGDEA